MQQINLLDRFQMKQNQTNNDLYENRENQKSIYTIKSIILIIVTIIVGLGFITAVILISIEFNQIHRLSQEASAIALQTSNSINLTLLSTMKSTNHSTIVSTTTPMITITSTTSTTILTTTTITTTIVRPTTTPPIFNMYRNPSDNGN